MSLLLRRGMALFYFVYLIMIHTLIDRLTNSIENLITGEKFNTKLSVVKSSEISKRAWLFDWHGELTNSERIVLKLYTIHNPKIIQGLLSYEKRQDHIFVHLIENSSFNRGKSKMYAGVAGNLFAFACKDSFDSGFDGYVSFVSKTSLIPHYHQALGATVLSGAKMVIETPAALKLVNQYYKDFKYEK
jgi:hypothetical protein